MAISNFQEKLLFYTRQKSRIGLELSNIQMRQLTVSKSIQAKQQQYNKRLSDLYHNEEYGYGTDLYSEQLLELQNEHEFEMSNLNSWESQLELQKEAFENQLNEIQSYEKSWENLLKTNIKNDFAYGGGGGK